MEGRWPAVRNIGKNRDIELITYRPTWEQVPRKLCFYLTEEMHELALVAVEEAYIAGKHDGKFCFIAGRDALEEDGRGYEIFRPWREALWELNGTRESTAYWLYPDGVQQIRYIDKESYNKMWTRDPEGLVFRRAAARLDYKYPGNWPYGIVNSAYVDIAPDCQNMQAGNYESRWVDRTLSVDELCSQYKAGGDQCEAWEDARSDERVARVRAAGGQAEYMEQRRQMRNQGTDPDAERFARYAEMEAKMWAEGKPPAWPPPETALERVTSVFKNVGRVR